MQVSKGFKDLVKKKKKMVAVNSLYTQSKWLEGGDQKGIFLWGKKKKKEKTI